MNWTINYVKLPRWQWLLVCQRLITQTVEPGPLLYSRKAFTLAYAQLGSYSNFCPATENIRNDSVNLLFNITMRFLMHYNAIKLVWHWLNFPGSEKWEVHRAQVSCFIETGKQILTWTFSLGKFGVHASSWQLSGTPILECFHFCTLLENMMWPFFPKQPHPPWCDAWHIIQGWHVYDDTSKRINTQEVNRHLQENSHTSVQITLTAFHVHDTNVSIIKWPISHPKKKRTQKLSQPPLPSTPSPLS